MHAVNLSAQNSIVRDAQNTAYQADARASRLSLLMTSLGLILSFLASIGQRGAVVGSITIKREVLCRELCTFAELCRDLLQLGTNEGIALDCIGGQFVVGPLAGCDGDLLRIAWKHPHL